MNQQLQQLAELPPTRVMIISIVIAGLYYLLGFDGGERFKASLKSAEAKKSTIQAEIAKVDQELIEIRQLKEAQERDSERLNAFLSYIPEKLTKTELMRTLGNEAKSVGVSINQIRDVAAASKKGEFYEEIGVDVELVGNFAQHMLFLSNLTRLSQILSIESLELRGSVGDSESLTMTASVRGYRYVGVASAASGEKR